MTTGSVLPTTPPSQSTTASGTIPTTGGAVSVTYNGIGATVTAPAGAFAAAATLTVTLGAPTSTNIGTFSTKRVKQSVPAGATPLASLTISSGGATLLLPLTVTFTGIAGPATGTSVLLSGNNSSAWVDVAAMTFAGTTYSETTDPHYPGLTLASPTAYVLYNVATANVATPTATLTVTGPAQVGTGAPTTYVASEATSNGFPFLAHTYSYGVTPATIGTIVATTGVFTGSGTGGTGSVTAADAAVTAYAGSLAVAVNSARPGYAGFTQAFAGTMTEVDANNAISTAPVSLTIASTVATTVATTNDSSGNTVFTASETDKSNISTLTSTTATTVAYQGQPTGTTNVRALKTVSNESTGAIYEHDYGANNGLLTVLPETSGSFTNDAAQEYKETDPGIGITAGGTQGVTTDKLVAASGAYSATINEPNYFTGVTTADTQTENVDFSGVFAINSIDPGNYQITYGAPAGGNIVVTLSDPNFGPPNPNTVVSWIPAINTQPSQETDTIVSGATLDSSCAVPASVYSGTANQVTQTQDIVDAIAGTYEHRVATSYDVNGAGTICTVLSDTVESFYDYSGQEGEYTITFDNSGTAPLLTTTITETLSLQPPTASSTPASLASSARSAQAVAVRPVLPIALLAAHVEHLAHQRAAARMAQFRKTISLKYRGGSAK